MALRKNEAIYVCTEDKMSNSGFDPGMIPPRETAGQNDVCPLLRI